jgi:hypothetical protein
MFTKVGVEKGSEIEHLKDCQGRHNYAKGADHYKRNGRTYFLRSKFVKSL